MKNPLPLVKQALTGLRRWMRAEKELAAANAALYPKAEAVFTLDNRAKTDALNGVWRETFDTYNRLDNKVLRRVFAVVAPPVAAAVAVNDYAGVAAGVVAAAVFMTEVNGASRARERHSTDLISTFKAEMLHILRRDRPAFLQSKLGQAFENSGPLSRREFVDHLDMAFAFPFRNLAREQRILSQRNS